MFSNKIPFTPKKIPPSIFTFPPTKEKKQEEDKVPLLIVSNTMSFADLIDELHDSSSELNNGENMFSFFLLLMTNMNMNTPENVSIQLQNLIHITYTFLLENVQTQNSENVGAAFKMLVILLYLNAIIFLHDSPNFEQEFEAVNIKLMQSNLFEKSPYEIMDIILSGNENMELSRVDLNKDKDTEISIVEYLKTNKSPSMKSLELHDLLCENVFYKELYKSVNSSVNPYSTLQPSVFTKIEQQKSSSIETFDDFLDSVSFGEVVTPFQKFMFIYVFPTLLLSSLTLTDSISNSNSGEKKRGGMNLKFYIPLLITLLFGLTKVEAKADQLPPELSDYREPQRQVSEFAQIMGLDGGITEVAVQKYLPRSSNPTTSLANGLIAGAVSAIVVGGVSIFAAPVALPFILAYTPIIITGTELSLAVAAASVYSGAAVAYTNVQTDARMADFEEFKKKMEEAIKKAKEKKDLQESLLQQKAKFIMEKGFGVKLAYFFYKSEIPITPKINEQLMLGAPSDPVLTTEIASIIYNDETDIGEYEEGLFEEDIFVADFIKEAASADATDLIIDEPTVESPADFLKNNKDFIEFAYFIDEIIAKTITIPNGIGAIGLAGLATIIYKRYKKKPKTIFKPDEIQVLQLINTNIMNFYNNIWPKLKHESKQKIIQFITRDEVWAEITPQSKSIIIALSKHLRQIKGGKHKKTRKNKGKKTRKNKGKNKRQSKRTK